MHVVAGFKVTNNGELPVIISANHIRIADVKVFPGETSPVFGVTSEYRIKSEVEKPIFPPPEVLVIISGGHVDTLAINAPSVEIDVIVIFDFPPGDPVLSSHTTQNAHYF